MFILDTNVVSELRKGRAVRQRSSAISIVDGAS